MSLKTKRMKKIWEPIEIQLNNLQKLYENTEKDTPEIKSVKSVVLEHFSEFNKKLTTFLSDESDDFKEMKEKMVEIIDNFGEINYGDDVDQQDVVIKVRLNFFDALKTLERLECLELEQQLQDSCEYVKEMGEIKGIEDFENIKELGACLLDVVNPLQLYGRNLTSVLLKEKIILYCSQLSTTFVMLANLVQQQHDLNLPIYNTKVYICTRICQCLKMIIDVLEAENPTEDDEIMEKEEHFVFKMDLALDLISTISEKNREEQIEFCDDLWAILEQVFSHTMAIAQVCHLEHFEAITGVSKFVISEFGNLKHQLMSEKPDKALNNLFVNTFTDALYRLERQVNISMLSLVMEVFSEPFSALKKLVQLCGNSLPPEARQQSDLSNSIEDFDQITDKVMQIGLYAMACCNDINKISRIKNHMASLESLNLELITSITLFYLDPRDEELRAGVKLLTSQWQSEVNKLHTAIDLIIDSAAYCQVILDDLQNRIQLMNECFDNRQDVTQRQVKTIIYRACALATQITAAVDDIGRENIDKSTIMVIRELKAATFEADAASKTLLKPNAPAPQQLRVIKRCELLLNVVTRLQPILVVVMNKSQSLNALEKTRDALQPQNNSRNKSNLIFVRTPYTVKNYKPPISIQPPNSSPKTPLDMSCLISYIKKGQMMRSEKSIMYKTPKAQKSKELKNFSFNNKINRRRNLSCVRQHLFSRNSFVSNKDVDLSAVSLNLSGVLNEISTHSDSSMTVSSTGNSMTERETDQTDEKNDKSATFDSVDVPSTMIETPDRINDIENLEKKIKILQDQKNN